MKTKIVPAKIPYPDDCGDILSEVVRTYVAEPAKQFEMQPIPLCTIGHNNWNSCKWLGIDAEVLAVTYECPFVQDSNLYYYLLPTGVFTQDVKKYEREVYNKDYVFDSEWHKQMWQHNKQELPELNGIERSFMGHGYEYGTLPCDGNGSLKKGVVELDNGDFLGVYFWLWFNK